MPNENYSKKDENAIYLDDIVQIRGENLSNASGISADNTSDDSAIKLHDLISLVKLREKYLHEEQVKQEQIARINAQIDYELKQKMAIMQNSLLQKLFEARQWEIQNSLIEIQQRHCQSMIRTAMMAAYSQYNFG